MRLTALFSFLCLTCSVGLQPALADDPKGYLALGDSLAFGFNPLVMPVNLSKYHGYPEIIANAIHRKLANASCFGETSSHFLNLGAPDLGCQAWRAAYPLFVSYHGTQMDYAVQYLSDHRKTELVTIDIGINDLGLLLQSCAGNISCGLAGLPAVLATYQANLVTIYESIRLTGYDGPIIAVTGYAVNYSDPVEVPAITALNSILSSVTTAFGGKIADAFTAFEVAALPFNGDVCQTGLLIKLPNNTCDTHPSAAGQGLLAKLVLNKVGKGDSDTGRGYGDENQRDHPGQD
jgi:lysophospholipase L1-like esterase